MSTDTRWEEGPDAEAVLDRFERWYHVPALLLVLAYMLWIRIRPRGRFIRDGRVFFRGNDAYYHFRATMYSVQNWPDQLYGDPWTYFPYGGNVGNFGSLMDQAVATVALIVGLGDPSRRLVAVVAILSPAVIATFVALLAYVLAKHLGRSRVGGLTAAALVALIPQSAWVARGTAGFYDHHIAEAFMMTASVLAMVYAISVVRRERPVWEQVVDRDWEGLWPSAKASGLAGLVVGLYLHTWAPGILVVGIFGIFLVVAICLSVFFGESPEHLVFAGAISMAVGALTILPWTLSLRLSNAQLTLLQVLLLLAVGGGCAFLGVLSRYWDHGRLPNEGYSVVVGSLGVVAVLVFSPLVLAVVDLLLGLLGVGSLPIGLGGIQPSFLEWSLLLATGAVAVVLATRAETWSRQELRRRGYPIVVACVGIVSIAAVWLLLPGVFDSVYSGLTRIFPISYSPTRNTVSEAQPMTASDVGVGTQFYRGYGFTFFTALAAIAWLAIRGTVTSKRRSEYLLVAIWSVFVISMAITQVRFHYYLAPAVAILNGWLVVQVLGVIDYPSLTAPEDLRTYHVLTVFAVLLLLVVPIASPIAVATAADSADGQYPGGVQVWQPSLDWMAENTPEPGQYAGADNQMEYLGPFDSIDDYAYPQGAYGVMSWWDYGHWITVEGERIPNANPFQEGPQAASAFFQETNETRANLYLEALPANESIGSELYDMSTEELQSVVANRTPQEASEETRYVVIDDQMAGGKFSAITEWTGPGYGAYVGAGPVEFGNQTLQLNRLDQRYDDTMLSQLYYRDAQGLEHYRLVHEAQTRSTVLSVAQRTGQGSYDSVLIGIDIRTLQGRFPGVYQSVVSGDGQFVPYDIRQESAVKTYERVEGATLTGEAGANETVTATLEVATNANRTFTYFQQATADEDGDWSMTVPYSTDNQLGPADGYTDTAVVANGTYSVFSGNFIQQTGTADGVEVPEPAIYEGQEIEVELESPSSGGNDSASQAAGSSAGESGASAPSELPASARASSGGAPGGSAISGSAGGAPALHPSTAVGAVWATAAAAGSPVALLERAR